MLYIMNMQITIWVSSVSLHAYADISFKSTSDVSITLIIWFSWMKCELIFDLANIDLTCRNNFIIWKYMLKILSGVNNI